MKHLSLNMNAKMRLFFSMFIFLLCEVTFAVVPANEISFSQLASFKQRGEDISCIIQDKKGFIWVGSDEGVTCFDGQNNWHYRKRFGDTNSLLNNDVIALYQAKNDIIWVGLANAGLSSINPNNKQVQRIQFEGKDVPQNIGGIKGCGDFLLLGTEKGLYQYFPESNTLTKVDLSKLNLASSHAINHLTTTSSGDFLAHTSRELILISCQGSKPSCRIIASVNKNTNISYAIEDSQKNIWFGTAKGKVYHIPSNTNHKIKVHDSVDPDYQLSNKVNSILEDHLGYIWFSQDLGQLVRIKPQDKDQFSIHHFSTSEGLSPRRIKTLFLTDNNLLFAGTLGKGLFIGQYDNSFKPRIHFENKSLSNKWIRCIYSSGNRTWIGGNNGLDTLHANNLLGKVNDELIAGNYITWINGDATGRVWISSRESGLTWYNPATDTFQRLHLPPHPYSRKTGSYINQFCFDKKGSIWVIRNDGSIYVISKVGNSRYEAKAFSNSNYYAQIKNLKNKEFRVIHVDMNSHLWIGGLGTGAFRISLNDQKVQHFTNSFDQRNSIPHNTVFSLAENNSGSVYLGTLHGIARFNDKSQNFKTYSSWHGVSANSIYGMLFDSNNNLWIGTNEGLTLFNPQPGTFRTFNVKGEFKSNVFTKGVAKNKQTNRLYFGTNHGLLSVSLDSIPTLQGNYGAYINEVSSSGKILDLVRNEDTNKLESLQLKHDHNDISFSFSSPQFSNGELVRYSYKLSPIDKRWKFLRSGMNLASYNNLDHGSYEFNVRVVGPDGKWNKKIDNIHISITPPFWKTWWAYLIYTVLFSTLVIMLRRVIINRQRLKRQVEQERMEKLKNEEINNLKLKFFTSISHDIRTPLTLINGPLEDLLIESRKLTPFQEKKIKTASDNAKHLKKLVDQLLDFRKTETGKMKYNPQPGNLTDKLTDIFNSFSELAVEKNINYKIQLPDHVLWLHFDPIVIDKILYNLISNAFKHTPQEGEIHLITTVQDEKLISISVKDNGCGIAQEDHEKIFERYYQAGSSTSGTGIGLALTRELVNLHQGTISLESSLGEGSAFTISIPYSKTAPLIEDDTNESEVKPVLAGALNLRILVVEDNPEVNEYIVEGLSSQFIVKSVHSANEALEQIQDFDPHLILSDVMMPGLDGREFCKIIKSDINLSHIPVILLTALSETEEQIKGLESGADAYITKPFSMNLLKVRIRTLIEAREKLRELIKNGQTEKQELPTMSRLDKEFMEKVNDILKENLDNPDFDVNHLVKELAISRSLLHMKLKNIAGQSAGEFIRGYKLNKAAELLRQGYNVSESAYRTGFGDPRYFSTCFKKHFGISPSKYPE
ncbi:hybrid sensor histidine kinase/response regulator [Puteibacter caeruleilacunae]|nr:hybrid sensor histidine kinase/response regulator [Puteibacter caeruleilacunae]